jgi:hypothetical protein
VVGAGSGRRWSSEKVKLPSASVVVLWGSGAVSELGVGASGVGLVGEVMGMMLTLTPGRGGSSGSSLPSSLVRERGDAGLSSRKRWPVTVPCGYWAKLFSTDWAPLARVMDQISVAGGAENDTPLSAVVWVASGLVSVVGSKGLAKFKFCALQAELN